MDDKTQYILASGVKTFFEKEINKLSEEGYIPIGSLSTVISRPDYSSESNYSKGGEIIYSQLLNLTTK